MKFPNNFNSIEDRVKYLIDFIENKRMKLGFFYNIEIVAVSKTFSVEEIKKAIKAGIKNIGESRIQEAEEKFSDLKDFSIKKHLIGHLQSNKINKALELFDVIQSIDSIEIAKKINTKLEGKNRIFPVLIEVNTSGEETKFGIMPTSVVEFVSQVFELKNLKIEGFMTIAPNTNEEKEIRKSFRLLYNIREKINQTLKTQINHLSMGMSDDFEIAIEEGATIIRPGRIIFGERN